MKFVYCLLITIGLLSLTACGPIYQTKHDYVPPHSSNGKNCAAQCIQSKSYCNQMSQTRESDCREHARQDAEREYHLYKDRQKSKNLPIEKSPSDFEHSSHCSQNSDCDSAFDMCYTTCGGIIKERKECVAFCDKK